MRSLFDAIYEIPLLAGFCYTQLTDTMQETNGLLDENRRPKLPIEVLSGIISRPAPPCHRSRSIWPADGPKDASEGA